MQSLIEALENRQLLSTSVSIPGGASDGAAMHATPRAARPSVLGTYGGNFRATRSSGAGSPSRGSVRSATLSFDTEVRRSSTSAISDVTGFVTINGLGSFNLDGTITNRRLRLTITDPGSGNTLGVVTGVASVNGRRITARFALDFSGFQSVGKLTLARTSSSSSTFPVGSPTGVLQGLPGGTFGSTGVGSNIFGSTLAGSGNLSGTTNSTLGTSGFFGASAFTPDLGSADFLGSSAFTPGFSTTTGTLGVGTLDLSGVNSTASSAFSSNLTTLNPSTLVGTQGGAQLVNVSGLGSGMVDTGTTVANTTGSTSGVVFSPRPILVAF